jgi:hypothetical protein
VRPIGESLGEFGGRLKGSCNRMLETGSARRAFLRKVEDVRSV